MLKTLSTLWPYVRRYRKGLTLGIGSLLIKDALQAALPLVKGAKLRALAVTSLRRVDAIPGVPTVAESGYPDFVAIDWKALVAPARAAG